jgi:DNA-directed RNA polymerase specialized sigma24 family protein
MSRADAHPLHGDEEDLFRTHHEQLVEDLSRRLCIPPELAEDAVAFAWTALLRNQPNRDRIVGWLYTAAKHEAFAQMKRRSRETLDMRVVAAAPDADIEDAVEARCALAQIESLKPQQRVALYLRIEGYSYLAIGELTGRTYTWVNRHVSEGTACLARPGWRGLNAVGWTDAAWRPDGPTWKARAPRRLRRPLTGRASALAWRLGFRPDRGRPFGCCPAPLRRRPT